MLDYHRDILFINVNSTNINTISISSEEQLKYQYQQRRLYISSIKKQGNHNINNNISQHPYQQEY